ncbi:MAG: DUF1929 domain-containing protein [Thermaceae bacterium]|nr:DUF1929 domain-containing protein [Thermaceae bacterium]
MKHWMKIIGGLLLVLVAACNPAPTSQPPTPPTGFSATYAAPNINLSWTAVAGATYYVLQRSSDGTNFSALPLASNFSGTFYSDTSIQPAVIYTYRLQAANSAGSSAFVNSTPITTPPAAPASLTATATSSTSINLSWAASSGATGYVLERQTGSSSFAALTSGPSGTGTNFSDTTVVAGTTYTYRIKATNAGGSSNPTVSNPVTTPGTQQPPSSPNNFAAGSPTANSLTLTWTAPAGATGYSLKRSTDNTNFSVVSPAPTGSPYTDNSLAAGTKYYYQLVATNAAGSSSPATANGTTSSAATVPGSPGSFSGTLVTGTSSVITLTWTAPTSGSPVTSYKLERSTDGGTTYTTLSSGLTPTTLKYADLSANGISSSSSINATYRLTAVGAGGSSAPVTTIVGSIPGLCNASGPNTTTTASTGCFGAPFQFPLVATFGGLQPDGTFLAWYSADQSGAQVFNNYLDLSKHGSSYAVVWNPAKGRKINFNPNVGTPSGAQSDSAFVRVDNNLTDLFCAGQVIGPDGRFYSAGGNFGSNGGWYPGSYMTNIYDWRTKTWTAGPNMHGDPNYPYTPATSTSSNPLYAKAALINGVVDGQPNKNLGGRWYPSVITLSTGKLLINGGLGYFSNPYKSNLTTQWYQSSGVNSLPDDGLPKLSTPPFGDNVIPEVWDTTTNTLTQLTGARMDTNVPDYDHYYPWMFQDPYNPNRAFMAGGATSIGYLDVTGSGSWSSMISSGFYRHYGSAAMYQPGKILLVGGGGFVNPPTPSLNTATLLQLPTSGNSVAVTQLSSTMVGGRTHTDATVLPNGNVWVNGGNTDGNTFPSVSDLYAKAIFQSDMWNPNTLAFTPSATAQQPRIYHSTATLMQDGTVLTVGGGGNGNDSTGGTPDCTAADSTGTPTAGLTCGINQFNAEIYYPPYLFKPDGTLAPRLSILSVSSPSGTDAQGNPQFKAGNISITITTDQPASNLSSARVTFMKLGSTTHAFNTGQNFNELTVTGRSGSTLTVNAPSTYNYAPPGYYFLFVLDNNGVPSVAQIVYMSL